MGSWKELTDFSTYDKRIPCSLCNKEAEKTIVGEHWKCSICDHLFNQDGSVLPEAVLCTCETCNPRKKSPELQKTVKVKVRNKQSKKKKVKIK